MKSNKCSYKRINLKDRLIKHPCKYSYESSIPAIKRHLFNSDIIKIRFWTKFFAGQNISSAKIFVGQNYSLDKIFVTNEKFRHFCPTLFCPIRYIVISSICSFITVGKFPLNRSVPAYVSSLRLNVIAILA